MRRLALVIPFTAAAAVLSGCGSSGTASTAASGPTSTSPSTPAATVTDTVVPPPATTTATATVAAGPVACATANLSVALGPGQGAAGHVIYPVRFANKGATCTITGYPGVSLVAPGSGKQVGQAATRAGGSTATITLTAGASAYALVSVANYQDFTPSQCDATPVSGLRVYPPNNKTSAYVAFPSPTMGCTIGGSEVSVESAAAGTGS